jgi:hypothetical protein
MKVVNKTEYSTRELRLIFHQVVRDLLKKRPSWKAGWKRHGGDYIVKTGNRRKDDFTSGHAYIGLERIYERSKHGGWVRAHNLYLGIAKDVSVAKLAATFEHELYHAFGVGDHGDFPPGVNDCNPEPFARYPELLGLPERLSYVVKATKPRATKEELQLGRIEKLLGREKAWMTKRRRTDTALKKIRKSLKHYEREGHDVSKFRVAANRKRGRS